MANVQAVTDSERRAGLEKGDAEADLPEIQGRLRAVGREELSTRGRGPQPEAREGEAGWAGVANRLVVPERPGKAGGGHY